MQYTVVERELELRLALSPERGVPCPARPGYRPDAPHAVRIAFHVDSGHPAPDVRPAPGA